VKKGFAILNECLAQSFAALADDLSDELPSLVKVLRKSGLDNTEGSEGLVSKAQQAPLASFLNMAGDEPWEALAVTLMGVAEHLESMLRRTFGRAQQDAEAMWPLLTRAHEMLAALYESGKRVYSRERSLTVDLTSLVLDCVNSYRFEPRPTRWQLDKNHSSDQGVPTITAPLEWQSSPHHRETHRLGRPVYSLAGQDISNVFPVVQIDGSEPPMERFFELITTYNRGHERGQACWKDLEARVLEQVQDRKSVV
jgi:hypothetical protein